MASIHFISEGAEYSSLVLALMESFHHGVSVTDQELNLVIVNRRAKEILDLPEEVFRPKLTLFDILLFNARRGDYGPGDPAALAKARIDLARDSLAHDFERERPDGTIIRVQGTPLAQGGFITIYTDVTREREVERRLEESQNELETRLEGRTRDFQESRDLLFSAVEAIPDALVMTDCDGALTLANSVMKSLLPNIEEHICGKDQIVDVFSLDLVTLTSNSEFFEHIAVESDQRLFGNRWFRIQCSPVSNGGQIVVFSDISDFKKQNKTLRSHADQLVKHLRKEKRLNEMQREFVSMASHEFRTPLAIIDGAAQRLKRRVDRLEKDDVLERVERIRDAVGRMQYLIDRFIDSSGAQSGTMEIDPSPQPIDQLLGSICRQKQQIHTMHKIEMSLDVAGVVLNIDKRMIEQCILNVLSNAIKYSPGKDRVVVEAHVEGRNVVISVTDFGVGIPKNEIPKIFGRYFRASTASGIPGTGIGLNLTEMIMDLHRGKTLVTSVVGEGTTVTLRLPYMKAGTAANHKPKKLVANAQ